MQNILLRNLPDETLSELDKLCEKRKVSRNQLISDILELYIRCQDENLHKLLPKIVECEVKDELKKFEESTRETMNLFLVTLLKMAKTNEKLNTFLFPELENLNIDGMNCEQILSIINSETELNDDDFLQKIVDVDF
jgi:hypothetical protein